MTTTVPCYMPYLGDPRRPCVLPIDHDGPHVTRNGRGWHDSDDMDGGVTAAQIEKEAERGARGTATDAALARYWLKEYDRAEARAEKAEDRADDAHNLIVALRADLAATEARAEQAEKERDEARAGLTRLARALDLPDTATVGDMIARIEEINAGTRPLTPDAITAEDLRGVVRVVVIGPNGRDYDRGDLYSHGARAVIQDYGHTLKVFAAPPPPPEWADLAGVLGDLDVSALVDTDDLARQAHARGVRVVTEEQQ